MKKNPLVLLMFLLGCLVMVAGGEVMEISVSSGAQGKVDYEGFTMIRAANVHLNGKVANMALEGENRINAQVRYGWILETSTRELKWSAFESCGKDSKFEGGILPIDTDIFLPEGDYELYYVRMDSTFLVYKWKSKLAQVLPKILAPPPEKELRDMGLTLSGPKDILAPRKILKDQLIPNQAVSITGVGDQQSMVKGFSLKKDTQIEIYAIGEGSPRDGGIYDYGWIMDVDNHRRVWTMTARSSVFAGGTEKNILVKDSIVLPKGSYTLHYVTDDSHSPEKWNANPPSDPLAWGITLKVRSKELLENFASLEQEEGHAPFLQIVRVRDNQMIGMGFKLTKDIPVQILCIGEQESSNGMADFGWIIDAETLEKVWEMKKDRTQHAGGANKNRMVDEVLTFHKGAFIAYYKTDNSHSYDDWNDSPPYNKEKWGLTLTTRNKEDIKFIELFNPKDFEEKSVIEKIVKVGNYQYKEESFNLRKDTRVRIQAIGEGTHSDGLVDYGWLEDEDTGKVVWMMTMEKTEHAGGAKKNRQEVEILRLKAGHYKLGYQTDGSHAYNSWNSDPPDFQDRYGIMIFEDHSKKD